jgi:hypothetical protein
MSISFIKVIVIILRKPVFSGGFFLQTALSGCTVFVIWMIHLRAFAAKNMIFEITYY